MALRRHLIVEFADCMLMPATVNDVDSIIDAEIGRELFAGTADVLLNERGATWHEGVEFYRDGLRAPLSGAMEMYTRPGASHFQAGNTERQHMLEMVEAYYEGLFLHSSNKFRIASFMEQVRREMAAGTQPGRPAAGP
jgi:hypothetical protein